MNDNTTILTAEELKEAYPDKPEEAPAIPEVHIKPGDRVQFNSGTTYVVGKQGNILKEGGKLLSKKHRNKLKKLAAEGKEVDPNELGRLLRKKYLDQRG